LTDVSGLLGIVVAALGGAAVGVERQRSGHASGRLQRFGGIRTFTLLGGVAGLAGWLATQQFSTLASILVAGAVALVVAGYVAASRQDVDGTTEAAALVVVGAGVVAGLGWLALASGIVAICTLLLTEKSRLHTLVKRIDDEELRAAARFGVMAIVILPLLPEGPIGALGGIRPRQLWMLVLFFTGLSFCGYLARRLFGAAQGYAVAGLLGGVVSSTNVALTFARLSRQERILSPALAVGTIGACTMLFPRVLLAACVLNRSVARALLPYFIAPFLIGLAMLAWQWKKGARAETRSASSSNPLQLLPALQMAVLFQAVLFIVDGVHRYFGEAGVRVSGAVLGLTDVDALTISMTQMADVSGTAALAAQAIVIGILANGLMKTLLTTAFGAPQFSRVTGGVLAAMALATAVSLAVIR